MRSSNAQPGRRHPGAADAGNGFTFTPQFSLVYYTNFAIRFDGGDSGCKPGIVSARLMLSIPKEEQDNSLKDQFAGQYRAGILAWIVQGRLRGTKTAWAFLKACETSTGRGLSRKMPSGNLSARILRQATKG